MAQKPDHSEIQWLLGKLIDGSIDQAERHRLDALAKSDPFLADAIEGFAEGAGSNESLNLIRAELSKRVGYEGKEGRIPIWMRSAAAVAVILVGIWVIRSSFSTETVQMADNQAVIENPIQIHATDELAAQSTSLDLDSHQVEIRGTPKTAGNNPVVVIDGIQIKEELQPLQEQAIKRTEESRQLSGGRILAELKNLDDSSQKLTEEQEKEFIKIATPSGSDIEKKIADMQESLAEQPVTADYEVPLVPVENDNKDVDPSAITQEAMQTWQPGDVQNKELMSNALVQQSRSEGLTVVPTGSFISGKVQDDTGFPLIGANVLLSKSFSGTITDIDGNFKLTVPDSGSHDLVVNYVGYNDANVTAVPGEDVTISMDSDGIALSEVVVSDLGVKRKQREVNITAAPIEGMRDYKKHIRDNLRYPEAAKEADIRGKVQLQFTVLPDGTPSNIRILKSLGYGCDAEAIRLIEEGPHWKVDPEGYSAQVEFSIKF